MECAVCGHDVSDAGGCSESICPHKVLGEVPQILLTPNQKQIADMLASVKSLTESFDTVNEYFVIMAKYKRAKHTSFVAAGFTEEQALELVKSSDLM